MARNNLFVKILVYIISGYQYLISPILPRTCRFHPTCSEYTKEALLKYGMFKGLFFSFKRVLRCNPFNAGGYDPVDGIEN
jgi:putative membrane protein insertion efficiency factor